MEKLNKAVEELFNQEIVSVDWFMLLLMWIIKSRVPLAWAPALPSHTVLAMVLRSCQRTP